MANIIPFIAEKLGVAIGEEFKINEIKCARKWRFTETNLLFYDSQFQDDWVVVKPEFIGNLVLGSIEIKKLSFEPNVGQPYWTYTGDWEPEWEMKWCGVSWELMALKTGCVFRTKEEAMAARPARYKELTGKDWIAKG